MSGDDALQEALVMLIGRLLAALDRLEVLTRQMHPPRFPALLEDLGYDALADPLARVRDAGWPEAMVPFRDQIVMAGERVIRAFSGLRDATDMRGAYRATREQYRALEALYPLAPSLPSVSRFFLEPARRGGASMLERPVEPDTGVFHFDNETGTRGGFSVYVPEYLHRDSPAPVICALHGGAGHGRVFLWSWLREARTRGAILVAPTATGDTWSLMEPDIDSAHLSGILDYVRGRWNVDAALMLLTGMSDGGTFTLLSGLETGSPFTHLAPVAASFHPMLVTVTEPERIRGLPVYLTHGALDWMFPVRVGRTAAETLRMAGADVVYREIADLSHTFPRDETGAILDWFMDGRKPTLSS